MADDAIKGAALQEFLAWLERVLGKTVLVEVIEGLDASARASFDPTAPAVGILASTWYPAPVIHALLDGIAVQLGPVEMRRVVDEGGGAVMRRTLRGVYGTLFRMMATPERYAKHAGLLWRAYYRTGAFDVLVVEPGLARTTIHGWDGHHQILCDINRVAAIVIYEAMGCEGVSVERSACVGDGAPGCEFWTSWRLKDG